VATVFRLISNAAVHFLKLAANQGNAAAADSSKMAADPEFAKDQAHLGLCRRNELGNVRGTYVGVINKS
jgi:hypothetical protein